MNGTCVSSFNLKTSRGHLADGGMDGDGGNTEWISEKRDVKLWTGFSSLSNMVQMGNS
jgi:hypothetical protein